MIDQLANAIAKQTLGLMADLASGGMSVELEDVAAVCSEMADEYGVDAGKLSKATMREMRSEWAQIKANA